MRAMLAVTMGVLAGCATLRAPLGSRTWDGMCYRALHQDIQHLAGANAYDCGLLHLDAAEAAQTQIGGCARHAVGAAGAFQFGYVGFGDDSMFCDIAVRDADGQLYSLYVDYDVTGQLGTAGEHAAWSARRCRSIEFTPGTISRNSFFSLQACERAPDVLRKLEALRKTQ